MIQEKPIIGVTCSVTDSGYAINSTYADAVIRAGGLPVILPCGIDLTRALTLADGIIFSGGGDVHPKFYGEEPMPESDDIRERRDTFELELCRAAILRDIPMLCICRGAQVLNLCAGGSLWQHIEYHKNPPDSRARHSISIAKDSALSGILGETQDINSRHHQAVRQIGNGVTVSAYAPDGIIEAIEIPGLKFAIGVQWHPEELIDEYPAQLKLFEEFIRAAQK